MDESKTETQQNQVTSKDLFAVALKAGQHIAIHALKLWYCIMDPETPKRMVGTGVGALVYLVTPVDAVPDFIPFVGYSDDLGVLLAALAFVNHHVKPEHEEKARQKVAELFEKLK